MVIVRVAGLTDYETVADLHTQSWQQAYRGILSDDYLTNRAQQERRTTWQKRFTDRAPNQLVLLAELAGEVVGFICLYIDKDPEWGTLIDNLHVAPAHKGQGIGTVLMREGVRQISGRTAHATVYLYVIEANKQATVFYERMGGQRRRYEEHEMPDETRVPVWQFVWPISALAETA